MLKLLLANKKIIIILFIIVLVIISWFFVYMQKRSDKIPEKNNVEAFDWSALRYSRISFFNASKDRVSINIPEIWEGKYRIKEEGDSVTFYYLNDDGTTEAMFGFSKKKKREAGDKVLCQKNELYFILNNYPFESKPGIEDVNDGLDFMLKSLKCD